MIRALTIALTLGLTTPAIGAEPADWEQAAAAAAGRPPMSPEETDAWIRKLVKFVAANHLKTDPNSPQRGMVYEYFDTTRKGQFDQWVQGEALDTMHDGAWLASALATAYRATGDPEYREFLVKWLLPFYTRVLNNSDTLFNTKQLDVADKGVRFNLEHALQPGEKGFCPYWWDDGASVSLERRRLKDPLARPPFACTDHFSGKPNPEARLAGYSHGSSNHLAQDLGPMLMLGWLLLRESPDPGERKLADECARAAKHLQECRTRHGSPNIPAVLGPAALTNNDPALMKRLGGEPKLTLPTNHYTRFLGGVANPEQRHSTPGFMDDAQYTYYAQLARTGGQLPPAVLFKMIYDCYTEPMLFRYWSDNAPVLPGLNRFDLIGHYGKAGKFESYRSDKVVPVGSRFGPQNMVVCGWALQALDADPGLWERSVSEICGKDARVGFQPGDPTRFVIDGVTVELLSSRTELVIRASFPGDELKLTCFTGPNGTSTRAVLTLKPGQDVSAETGEGIKLEAGGMVVKNKDRTTALVTIPYTITKGQGRWGNGLELGRYSIRVGKETRNFVFASSESQVKSVLERELAMGLRVWEAIFAAKGFIPTGMGAGGDWDKFSDSGGYAHLISAASQYRIWKAKKRDWELHNVPKVN